MIYFLIAVLLGIGIAFYLRSAMRRPKPEQNIVKAKVDHNPYMDMRNMAYSLKVAEFGIEDMADDEIYGIISEMDMGGNTASVVTFISGDTSLYLSSGSAFIGAGQHEDVQKVVKDYVKYGQSLLPGARKIKKAELPESGMVNFNFLSKNGLYSIIEKISELESGSSEYSKLFIELNKVIAAIRIKSAR